MTVFRKRLLLLVPALAVGVFAFAMLMKSRTPPQREALTERVTAVRVIGAPKVAVVPRALGNGIVQPGTTWNAVSQVGGEIVDMHPELKEGAIIPAGELLFRIAPEEYGLAETRSQAEMANLRAQLRELEQRQRNLAATLKTERQALALARQEFERRRQLLERGTVSASEVDQQQREFLNQKNVVQNLENSLALIPAEREALEARLESGRTQLEGTRLDVGRTEIRAPFSLRIEKVNVELHQYAPPGSVLAQTYDIAQAEIPAQIPLMAMRGIVSGEAKMFVPGQLFSMDALRDQLRLTAVVRMAFGTSTLEWDARFERIGEQIDPKTRTVSVFVVVDDPYGKAVPGERPPLFKNMYCQVELRGTPLPARVVIPRSALRQGGTAYVAGKDNRLQFRKIVTGYGMGDFVVVKSGIEAGENVVVSDLQPAVEGQLLAPRHDPELRERLVRLATAEAPLQ